MDICPVTSDDTMESKVRRRVALEEQAFRVVERLAEETVNEASLAEMVRVILSY